MDEQDGDKRASNKKLRKKASAMVGARNRNGDLHMRAVRSDGWTEEQRGAFLDMLAATCNVDASANAAGRDAQSAKSLRRRDADFRNAWDEALDTGYAMLEAMVLENAQRTVASPDTPTGMTMADAIALLDKHRAAVARIRRGETQGHAVQTASARESYRTIVERIRVLRMRLDEGE